MDKRLEAFVVGWPIKHSRSPLIHNHWLGVHGLNGNYEKRACPPEDFEGFLRELGSDSFIGGNVTIPYKETAFEIVEHLDASAQALGAVNTIWLKDGVLHGFNTDGYGFLSNLDDRAPGWDAPEKKKQGALILGAGGAARAIVYSLVERGFSPVIIANRTLERAENLAKQFGPNCMAMALNELSDQARNVALVVNTTSVGMGDDPSSPVDLNEFHSTPLVNDIVYTPLMTPLLVQAKDLNFPFVDGLGMLLHQAVPGFEKWFGVRPSVTPELRDILLRDLGELAGERE